MALDDYMNVEMHRIRTEAALELCYVPLYRVDSEKKCIQQCKILA